MEPAGPQDVTSSGQATTPEEQLSALFGSYKAEWLRDQLFDLFAEPSYFPELTTGRPCILIGGRGTGKTTVLQCLSYEGRYALTGRRPEMVSKWGYYGIYYRVNTNRVTAFKGPELTEDRWKRTFSHYINLTICELLVRFLEWYGSMCPSEATLTSEDCSAIATSLHLANASTLAKLGDQLCAGRLSFEAHVNNIAESKEHPLSIQGAPIDTLCDRLLRLPSFKGKHLFLLLDEYENFEDYQQEVINTLIKHSGTLYTFKVGVRELGWRRKSTLNPNEQLTHPADYVRIDITDRLEGDRFKQFAAKVCNDRMARLRLRADQGLLTIESLLPGLSEDEEAELQGIAEVAEGIRTELLPSASEVGQATVLNELTHLQVFFLQFWAEGQGKDLVSTFQDFLENRSTWETRFGNYKHALLFVLRRGKRGIQKYYSGWDVLTQLAGANIRYLLELVDQSLLFHLRNGSPITQPVDPRTQTQAAQYVGKQNLSELEGLSVHGAQLTKLLLGLGRVFQTIASAAEGHTPEVTQFRIAGSDPIDESADGGLESEGRRLMRSAVMHLALIRSPGNKLGNEADTKEYDYMVHPIFCAFFAFSYRKKRKMTLTIQQLLGLVRNPRPTIREILSQNNRKSDETLPEQMNLFSSFFHDDK